MSASIKISRVSKRYGNLTVLDDLSLDIDANEFIVFLGPSGCGKSTLLKMIAGLETVDDGEIHINGKRVDTLSPGERGVAMVFQNYALYLHAWSGGREARAGIGKWVKFYNQQRPHSSLAGQTPHAIYWNGNQTEQPGWQTQIVA